MLLSKPKNSIGSHISKMSDPRPTIQVEGYKVLLRKLMKSKLNGINYIEWGMYSKCPL